MRKEKIKAKKKEIRGQMMGKKGVSGLGLGKNAKGEDILKIFVSSKSEAADVPSSITLDDGSTAEVEIVEVGEIQFSSFLGKYRPVQPGAVIGNPNGPIDGTVGAIAADNLTGDDVILGASHVLANFNNASIGDDIVQPSTQQGGSLPADKIGTLLRFVPLELGQGGVNYVDAAIVKPTNSNDVRERSFCSPINVKKDRAIGLVYATSPYITVINPIATVENLLNISLNKTTNATVGMQIHMCGAYSGYQVTNVDSINVDLWVNYQGNQILWEDQIVAPGVGTAGDSGAVFYQK